MSLIQKNMKNKQKLVSKDFQDFKLLKFSTNYMIIIIDFLWQQSG